ncbi:hypothetical protein Q4610_01985 [Sphingobium sp. HBC34]|uniref:Uncharacterized protein n=1 Tax=Sphingobium cyanobacteriorum TaxID=3063954 RepID=A0ABT8ZGY6_9SPHN|nr:hypothetical protein [Sphingobium sp. HBC34]MDO7833805.1 hypothetical protein [Sphingobium sp. HBC34]
MRKLKIEAGPSSIGDLSCKKMMGWILDFPLSDGKLLYQPSEFLDEANVKKIIAAAVMLLVLVANPAEAGDIVGPGRFCGYSPIIDLRDGEKVTTLEGGMHGGSFRWEGAFGTLEVHGTGWASRPKGRIVKARSSNGPVRFAQRRAEGLYQIAIWNGEHGAAYFTSPNPFIPSQLDAIDRVELFEEGQSPSNCKLRTIFSWE